jgi:hypothetical protein
MNLNIPIVWVELSRKPSKYLMNSIKLHVNRYPDSKKFLILNKEYEKYVDNLGVHKIFVEELPSFIDIAEFQNQSKNWKGLQKSYWTNTTARFFALNAFMKDQGINKLIHLESDCVLLTPRIIEQYFLDDSWGLKYAKQHKNYGCASIMLVNNQKDLQNFLDFTSSNWERDGFTDMNALGEFVDHNDSSEMLYSGSPHLKGKDFVFDGVTIGRFFIGGDARNSRWPFSARGVITEADEGFDPTSYNLKVESNSVYLFNSSETLELQNIHLHSKRIPDNFSKLLRIIAKDGFRNRKFLWTLGHIDMAVLNERFVSFLQRRILRNKDADPRFR